MLWFVRAGFAQPGTPDPGFSALALPNQAVLVMAVQSDRRFLAGGDFTGVGESARLRLARWQSDGSLDPSFDMTAGPNASVRALAIQGDGRIWVGGDFTTIRGENRRYLVRLGPDGSVDGELAPAEGPGGAVGALALLPDNRLLVGGGFTTYSGQPRPYLVRVNADGRPDATFSPGIEGVVRAIAVLGDGRILVGGAFNRVGGRYRRGVVRLHGTGAVDESFDPAGGPDGDVNVILPLPGGGTLIGGAFTEVNGSQSRGICQLGSIGLPDYGFRSGLNGSVSALARQPDGRILVGGDFTSVGGIAVRRLARLQGDGSLDRSFGTGDGADASVRSLALQEDGRLLVGGAFGTFGGVAQSRLIRLETSSAAPGGEIEFGASTFQVSESQATAEIEVRRSGTITGIITVDYTTLNGTAHAGDYTGQDGRLTFGAGETRRIIVVPIRPDTLVEDDETVELQLSNPTGGAELGGRGSATLVILNDDSAKVAGGMDAAFVGQAGGPVHALAIQPDGKVVVGGEFADVARQSRRRIARLNADGTPDPGFLPAAWLNGRVLALAVQGDGRILAGGEFGIANGTNRVRLARFLPDGTLDPRFNPGTGPNGPVQAILVQPGGDILVGGSFTSYAGEAVPYLVRVFSDGTRDPTFSMSLNGAVTALAVASDEAVIAGGDFTSAAGRYQARVLRFRADGTLDAAFQPGLGPGAVVRAIAGLADGGVVIGGSFSEVNGLGRRYLSRLGPGGLPDPGFSAELGSGVQALVATAGGGVLVGGEFSTVAGQSAGRLARLRSEGSPDPGFLVGAGANNTVHALAVQADGKVLVGGAFTQFAGVGRAHLVRLEGTVAASGGTLEFASLTHRIHEGQGTAVVEVRRSGPSTQAVTVDFETASGTANAGDYTPLAGRLTFPAGETRKTVSIQIRPDAVREDDETFLVQLGAPTGGAGLGAQLSTTVEILDDDGSAVVGGIDAGFRSWASGEVYALAAQEDGRVVAVGNFAQVRDGSRLRLARIQSDGTLDGSFLPGAWLNGAAHAVVVSSDGRILVGGAFTLANGVTRNRLARFTPDGVLDRTFDPGVGAAGTVYSLLMQPNGDVLIGGAFTAYQGQPRPYLARVFGDGSLDSSFQPQVNGTVWSLASGAAGRWVAGGEFTSAGGRAQVRVARFLETGEIDPTFNPGAGPVATVRAVGILADGSVLAGGAFTTVHGVPMRYFCRLDPWGLPDPWYRPDFNNAVHTLAVQPDGRVVVGGEFTMAGGAAANRVARLLEDGTPDPSFAVGTGANGTVYSIVRQLDGNLVVGGNFTQFDGLNRARLVRLHGLSQAAGGEMEFGASVFRISEAQASGTVEVRRLGTSSEVVTVNYLTRNGTANAGDYTSVAGTLVFGAGETVKSILIPLRQDAQVENDETVTLVLERPGGGADLGGRRAALLVIEDDDNSTASGGLDARFPGGASGKVSCIAVQPDGRVIVGGAFTVLQGRPRMGIGRLGSDGTLDDTFLPRTWVNGTVNAVVVAGDGRILIGGDFTVVNGVTRPRLAALDAEGNLDPGFDPGPGPNGAVLALLPLQGGGVLVGGSFSTFAGAARPYLVRLYSDGALDNDFPSHADAAVWALARGSGSGALVGGDFARIGGSARTRVARLLADGRVDEAFDPGGGPNQSVRAVVEDRMGGVLIGGHFTQVDGTAHRGLARLGAGGQFDPSYAPQLTGPVHAVAYGNDGAVIAGGDFTRAGGLDTGRLVRILPDGTVDPGFRVGTGANAAVYALGLQPDGHLVVGGDFTVFNGLERDRLVRVFAADPGLSIPIAITAVVVGQGTVRLTCAGIPGRRHVIEAASDLGEWEPVGTNTPAVMPFEFVDPQAEGVRRFYRLRSP